MVYAIVAISAVCRELGLSLHMDAHVLQMLRYASTVCADDPRAGIDVSCLAAPTRHGCWRAILFFNPSWRKTSTTHASRQANWPRRSCFVRRLGRHARNLGWADAEHGNACATCLQEQIAGSARGLEMMFPVQAKAVSVAMVDERMAALLLRLAVDRSQFVGVPASCLPGRRASARPTIVLHPCDRMAEFWCCPEHFVSFSAEARVRAGPLAGMLTKPGLDKELGERSNCLP